MLTMLETMRSSMFMPHGMCFLWQPGVLWLHAVSDTVIAVSYFMIPLALIDLVRRRHDIPFNWMLVMFGVFILGCGATHVMAVWTLWWPNYRTIVESHGGRLLASGNRGPGATFSFTLPAMGGFVPSAAA